MKTKKSLLFLFFLCSSAILFAQEKVVKPDSVKIGDKPTLSLPDSMKADDVQLKLPRLNPLEDMQPQFTPYDRVTVSPNNYPAMQAPLVQWHGVASDFINSKSRTAMAIIMPLPNLSLYSSATLGLVETPYFGKANYYILNAGASYTISPQLNVALRGGYNSDFGVMPYWNVGADAAYMINPNLSIDGGVNYMRTAGNVFGLTQSAVLIDLHGRYRLSDDWYVNAYGGMPVSQTNNQPSRPMLPMMNRPYYGGSVEYWIKPTVGVEGGVIWMRDMFSGKMRPQPKLELHFRPGR